MMKRRHLLPFAALGTVLGLGTVATATTAVPTFDPNANVEFDNAWGTERPDDHRVEAAFNSRMESVDRCVAAEKKRRRSQGQLQGDAMVQVKLNPSGNRPYGVNASLPNPYAKRQKLRNCLRQVAAGAPFPAYDGPPLVVDFEFELDPGYEIVEED